MNTRCKPFACTAVFVLSVMCAHEASAALARMHENPHAGTIVAYAAEPGRVAYDGPDGGHSPFATALLRYLEAPLDVGLMLRWVRDAVLESTSGDQKPMARVDLPGRSVYLAANPAAPSSTRQPQEWSRREPPDSHRTDGRHQRLRTYQFPEDSAQQCRGDRVCAGAPGISGGSGEKRRQGDAGERAPGVSRQGVECGGRGRLLLGSWRRI